MRYEVETDIDRIVEKGSSEQMEMLSEILIDSLDELCEYDEEMAKKMKMKIYVMANGKILTDEMKREWVRNMNPLAKWDEETVTTVAKNYNMDMPGTSAYVIMNMKYSDEKEGMGTGDDEESLMRYVNASKGWYHDKDASKKGEEKLFEYYFHIVK